MVILGLLLLAASVATAVSIAVSNTDPVTFDVFDRTVNSLSPGGLLLAGFGLGVAALLGLWLLKAGLRHSRARRLAKRQRAQQARSRVDELEEENIRLRQAVERRNTITEPAAAAYDADADAHTADTFELGGDRAGSLASADRPAERPADRDVVDVRDGERAADDQRERTIYPDDPGGSSPSAERAQTPTFDETARSQENRVFGRNTI